MTSRLYVDLHIIQSLPPSNVNRDDAGSPKQATYGGARRTRVSSQAWKRATRLAFTHRLELPDTKLGTRSKRVGKQLGERISARTQMSTENGRRLADALLGELGITPSKKNPEESSYLLFYGLHQLDRIADKIAGRAAELVAFDDKTLADAVKDKSLGIAELLTDGHPIDVALFGRMVADLPSLNVDAATQVAHAISTHSTDIEFDYFTAVDDNNTEDASAGMIGTVEFTSATLYRFATVGMHQLVKNLDGDIDAAQAALAAFIEGFTYSMPAGHANTFAHQTLPQLLSVAIRTDQPVNLVSAYENPVSGRSGHAVESVRRLDEAFTEATQTWGVRPERVVSIYSPKLLSQGDPEKPFAPASLGAPFDFSTLLSSVRDTVADHLAKDSR